MKARAVPSMLRPLVRNMLAQDDPDHARLKRLVQAVFTPRRVAMLEERTQAVSSALIDRLSHRQSFDLIRDYAFPLPVTVISELLGIPEADRQRFAKWSGALIRGSGSPSALVLAAPAILAFLRYLRRLIAAKRANPADDLISALIQIQTDDDGLSEDELMAMIAILLSAGHETTMNLIGNGMLALFDFPDAVARLRHREVAPEAAVEELLRYASPVESTTHRFADRDMTIAGSEAPRGTLVLGLIASANRDEQQFRDPDCLDFDRAPNRHLTFGEGGHYCLGAALARMESRVAFQDLITRMPGLRAAIRADRLRWRPGLVLRGLRSLPVTR